MVLPPLRRFQLGCLWQRCCRNEQSSWLAGAVFGVRRRYSCTHGGRQNHHAVLVAMGRRLHGAAEGRAFAACCHVLRAWFHRVVTFGCGPDAFGSTQV